MSFDHCFLLVLVLLLVRKLRLRTAFLFFYFPVEGVVTVARKCFPAT